MPAKPKPTPAERMRRHREAFTLALELHITPAEATEIIAARAAKARADAAQARLNALKTAPLRHCREGGNPAQTIMPAPAANPETPPAPWWTRD